MTSAPEPTDENTGLPPLDEQPDPQDTMYAMAFGHADALVRSPIDPEQTSAVFVLQVRGLVGHPGGGFEWAQIALAFPEDTVASVRQRIDEWLGGRGFQP